MNTSFRVIGVDEPVLIADRVPGQVIMRRTTPRGREVAAPLPCHPQEWITFPPGPATITAVCRRCLGAYTTTLTHPAGKSPLARYVFKDVRIHLSRPAR